MSRNARVTPLTSAIPGGTPGAPRRENCETNPRLSPAADRHVLHGPRLGRRHPTTTIQLTRSAIQAERQAMLAANLELDDKESAIFWPLYKEYRAAVDQAVNTRVDLSRSSSRATRP